MTEKLTPRERDIAIIAIQNAINENKAAKYTIASPEEYNNLQENIAGLMKAKRILALHSKEDDHAV